MDDPMSGWMKQWQALSRQAMAAWPGGVPAAPTPAAPDGFDQWSKLMGGAQGDTVERLMESARSYAAFMQSMIAAATAQAGEGAAPWNEALRRNFAAAGAGSLFEHPMLRQWQPAAAAQPPGFEPMREWLKLPAFGFLREHQEHYQKGAQAWLDYQEQSARYHALMLQAAQRGYALFEGKLAEREQPGRQIESLRALYDLWVDAAEEGYAEVALSPEFRSAYAALVNAQMRVRAQVREEAERVSSDLGIPTRSEIDSIGERLQSLRREMRAQAGEAALAARVKALEGELAALRARAGTPGADRSDAMQARPAAAKAPPAERARTSPTARPSAGKPSPAAPPARTRKRPTTR
jgi:poly[(R)-3-hydroxyalkanoate] polymerase subunit PhaE